MPNIMNSLKKRMEGTDRLELSSTDRQLIQRLIASVEKIRETESAIAKREEKIKEIQELLLQYSQNEKKEPKNLDALKEETSKTYQLVSKMEETMKEKKSALAQLKQDTTRSHEILEKMQENAKESETDERVLSEIKINSEKNRELFEQLKSEAKKQREMLTAIKEESDISKDILKKLQDEKRENGENGETKIKEELKNNREILLELQQERKKGEDLLASFQEELRGIRALIEDQTDAFELLKAESGEMIGQVGEYSRSCGDIQPELLSIRTEMKDQEILRAIIMVHDSVKMFPKNIGSKFSSVKVMVGISIWCSLLSLVLLILQVLGIL